MLSVVEVLLINSYSGENGRPKSAYQALQRTHP